jgi:hypothetical protein
MIGSNNAFHRFRPYTVQQVTRVKPISEKEMGNSFFER